MELDDLKTGMIVETRNGDSYIVMRDFLGAVSILTGISDNKARASKWIKMSIYTQDLNCSGIPSVDIVSVYSSYPCEIDTKIGLLWKREEYKEVTMSEIEEKFGCKVKIVEEDK